ncbi:uncharacterized protein LOC136074062 [Hydra vulgaris]|uniref:Uncharacterized protein LOC136074062 n=1 Tax=Hydra vulgaris TaxID=6087 RepID=A0ABM4B0Y0_HYDVU
MGNSLFSSSVEKEDEIFSKCCGEVSYNIGSDWLRWGRHLGLSDSDLDNIGSDNKICFEKADHVLKKWKQKKGNPSLEQLKKELMAFDRLDIVSKIRTKFGDSVFSQENVSDNVRVKRQIRHGCIFKFDSLEGELKEVKFQLYNDVDKWTAISNKKQSHQYYLTKKKNALLFVKVEKLIFENEKINFKFSFQTSKDKTFQHDCSVDMSGNCNYELTYNGLFIATPEPIFNNDFNKNVRRLNSLDWRETSNIYLDKIPHDKSIELFALDYLNINFSDTNVINVSPSIADSETLFFVVSKFLDLFNVNCKSICAVLPGYRLRYHASLLKCDVENFTNYNDENRIIIFFSEFNLVIIARVAISMDCVMQESETCLNDVILFVNVNNLLIDTYKLIILGIVVLPLHDRKHLREELFFYFSEDFDLDEILFICKDDFEDENFESWWRSVGAYCIKKVSAQSNNEELFKKLISLTIMSMAIVDPCYPTLESDTQKQIQSLILNAEQRNAVYDKTLKKIITGGYGSGKSIVGKEIVRNCITHKSQIPLTLYYICCNHFSLYECHMKIFVDSIEKTSNVEVVCNNLYDLWKNMCQKNKISNKYISLPKLLEYLASTNINKVCFVLEELSEEYVKEEDANQLKSLFTSTLKESLVVFIPESITKNRELVTNKQKSAIQRNLFQEEILGMKVISLNKSMRVTECNKLLIDYAQKAICETKSVLNIPNTLSKKTKLFGGESVKIKNENSYASNIFVEKITDSNSDQFSESLEKKFIDTIDNDFHDNDLDYMAKIIAKTNNNIDPNIYIETEYVFKSGSIGHSIKGEKPKVVYLPFYDIADMRFVKLLSIVLEKLCFNVLRKTVVICNNIEEVQSVAYAIDIIKNFKAVTYSPHLQQYSPTLEEKFKIQNKLRSDMDILVTDCKGFSGAESESVIVFVSPEEIYLRHVLVDAISRSNSYLTVFVKSCSGKKELLNSNKTIKYVLDNWSEEVVEIITVATSDSENQKYKDGFFIVDKNSKEFIDRGAANDFDKYKFQIFHQNNSIYENMASNLLDHVNKSREGFKDRNI